MKFIEYAPLECLKPFNMVSPHGHEFYEFSFLQEGTRNIFIEDAMFTVESGTLTVIPPYVMHKTEGGRYKRFNINISETYFSQYEKEIINKIIKLHTIKIDNNYINIIYRLLNEGYKIQTSLINNKEHLIAYFHAIILLISSSSFNSGIQYSLKVKSASSDILNIVSYLNNNFNKTITLKSLSEHFFISKTILCQQFKKIMNCSIMNYVFQLKINNAKQLLSKTDKSIQEISYICGFSSANYFGLMFKKATGYSPLNFRKR